jgi:putative SOS response-associated peptidase YedK
MMTWEELVELLGPVKQQVPIPSFRYNIAPSAQILVAKNENEQLTLTTMPWGVKPSWSKGLLINAQSEKYTGAGRSFWKAWQRCLIPASGFFEWQRQEGGKRPTFIRLRDREHFAMGGLTKAFEHGGVMVDMSVVLTTLPNALMADIHNRMPVIIKAQDHEAWLSLRTPPNEIRAAVAPYPSQEMEAWPVDHIVDNARNNRPECVTAVGPVRFGTGD